MCTPRLPSEAVVHHIPCSIKHDGVAKVSTYFVPERNTSAEDSSSSSSSQLTAYFRGRKLDGTSITLPSKVTGLILRESANTSSSDKGAVGTPDKLSSSTGEDEHQISKSALAALMAEDDDEDEGGGGGGSSDGGIEDGGGLWGSGMAMFMDEEDDEEARGGNSDKVAGKKRKAEDDVSSNAPSSSSSSASTSATTSFAPKREYQIDAKFSTLTSWSHDRPGTDHDLVNVAVEWIEVARVLHDSS